MEERVLDVRERKAIRRVVERDEVRELLDSNRVIAGIYKSMNK